MREKNGELINENKKEEKVAGTSQGPLLAPMRDFVRE